METEFIDWTSVVMCVVALVAVLKVLIVMHAMTELRSTRSKGSALGRMLKKGRMAVSYKRARQFYFQDFSFVRGVKKSWKIQLILCPFWILAADKQIFLEFVLVFGAAMLAAMLYGIRFSVSENKSNEVFNGVTQP